MTKHNAKLGGTFRHLLGAAGAFLVAEGYMTEDQLNEILGAILTLAAFVLSWRSPAKKAGNGDLE